MLVSPDDIVIPVERQREDVGDIVELADSIRRLGLINPITVDDGLTLIAGYRRLVAVRALGLTTVEVRKFNELSSVERYTLELEENIRRKQLTWQEEAKAKAELHRLLIDQHGQRGAGGAGHNVQGVNSPGWSLRDTAQMLGESLGKISEDISLAGFVDDPTVGNRKSRIEAIRTMKRVKEIQQLSDAAKELGTTAGAGEFAFGSIENGDSTEVLRVVPDDSVDLVLTDPPYGIAIEASRWATDSAMPVYTDAQVSDNHEMVAAVMHHCYRILKPGHYAFMFCAAQDTGLWAVTLSQLGFAVMAKPLIWCKGRGSLTDFQTQFGSAYETFICAWKRDGTDNTIDRRPFAKALADVFHYSRPSERWHKLERPVDLLKDVIETASVAGNLVVDPFCGGGSTLAAAFLTARRFLGVERDPMMWGSACERMRRLEAGLVDEPEAEPTPEAAE